MVIESGREQWIGTESEYLLDFGRAYIPGSTHSLSEVAAGCRKREARDNPAPTLAEAKTIMWRRIHDEREQRRLTGGVYVAPYWFHSDEPSRSQYGDLLTMALEKSLLPTYVLRTAWKTMSGATTPMTVALLRQIRDAGFVTENAIYDNAEVHKAAMEASPTPLSYDYSTGWPVSFV